MENETGGTVKKSTDGGPEKTIAIWAGVAVVLIILAVVAIPAFAEYFKKGQAGAAHVQQKLPPNAHLEDGIVVLSVEETIWCPKFGECGKPRCFGCDEVRAFACYEFVARTDHAKRTVCYREYSTCQTYSNINEEAVQKTECSILRTVDPAAPVDPKRTGAW